MLHVAVIGGGCAGLAAAARLAEQNIPVTLFEAARQLGGRARSLRWNGHTLDNGQHILLGAYSETLSLLKLAGVDQAKALLRLPLQLTMQPGFELRACHSLPAPLHILCGLMLARGLSWRERWFAVRFMSRMRLAGFKLGQDQSLAELLEIQEQPEKLTRLLWEPICLAALNTPIAKASAQVFLNVLRDSFLQTRTDSDMLLAKQDLSRLLALPLAEFIKKKQGRVETATAIDSIALAGEAFELEDSKGRSAVYSHVILAVPPFRVAQLTSSLPALTAVASCETMRYQPICTVYLQYDAGLKLKLPMTGLRQGMGQWVFDRGQLDGQHGLLAVVISAEGSYQNLPQEQLASAIAAELGRAFPQLAEKLTAPLWHKVITEKRATFACTPGLHRPKMLSGIRGLYLAGDYVAGDYPATMEGAARSGANAARHLIQSLQQGKIS